MQTLTLTFLKRVYYTLDLHESFSDILSDMSDPYHSLRWSQNSHYPN